MKCIKLVFSLKGQKNNIGSYLMSAFMLLFIGLTIFYIFNGQKKIKEIIDSILEMKKTDKNNIKEKNNLDKKINYKKEEKIKDKDERKKEGEKEKKEKKEKKGDKKDEKDKKEEKEEKHKKRDKKSKSSRKKTKKEKKNEEKELNAPGKRRGSKMASKKENTELQSKNYLNPEESIEQQNTVKALKRKKTKKERTDNKIELVDIKNYEKNKKQNIQKTDKPNEEKENENDIKIYTPKKLTKEEQDIIKDANNLNDEEINNLDYDKAILIDKRTYFQFYYSLLKKKHLILFIFLPTNDYNLVPIKIILFIISFSMYFTINGFFFSDDTMNKIYVDNGAFNFIYQLPQILYSTVVSAVINMILKRLSLSEKQIIQLKQEEDIKKCEEKGKSIQKCLKLRFILFLILTS